jgi:hypothetical protein
MLASTALSDWWFAGWIPSWSQATNFTLFNRGAFMLVSACWRGATGCVRAWNGRLCSWWG